MLVFSTTRFSSLSYRANFSRHSFANISFFDADRSHILFHLSLRADQALAVCNNRGTTSHDWGPEQQRPITLTAQDNNVEIRFAPPRVSVWINGDKVFSFGSMIGRKRFPNLTDIAFIDYQGGIQASALHMEYKAGAEGELTLSPRLDLHGRLDGTYRPEDLRLRIDGIHPDPGLIVTPEAKGTALRSVLPGRIWQGLDPQNPLLVQIIHKESTLLRHSLRLSDLLEQVQTALNSGDLAGDPVLATQIIEHARFSGLVSQLDPPQRDQLINLANGLELDPFLTLDTPAPADAPPPRPQARTQLQEALARVAQALHKGETPQSLLPVLDELSPTLGDMRPAFYIALAEPFCQRDAFDLLYTHSVSQGIKAIPPSQDDSWFNSGLLPYLLRDGRIPRLCILLKNLAERPGRWIMTAPLAWAVRTALHDPNVSKTARDEIIAAFLKYFEWRAKDYWQRTHCTQLTETAVAVIADGPRLPPNLHRWSETTLLQALGMSDLFWARLADRAVPLSPRMAAAQDAFAVLRDPKTAPAAKADALALFERIGNPDCARIRRDLFGPSGLPGPATPTMSAWLREGIDSAEAAMRYMAAPGSPESAPALEELILSRKASLPDLVGRAPHYALQVASTRRALKLLQDARAGHDPHEACRSLLSDFERLADPADEWIGLGVALGLLNGLIDAEGTEISRAELTDWLKQALTRAKTAETAPADPLVTPALAQPLQALCTRAAAGSPKAKASLQALEVKTPPALTSARPWPAPVNPLFDTVVMVTSCRANLDGRIPALRAGWLGRLAALGVPYLIVTGDGDGTLDGDVLHLDAPDDYEGLPQKSLAAIRWVHDNTPFAHMLKIDDDCFLNPEEYFHSLSYRKFNYYGRTLTRVPGQMDRAWHCAKSSSVRGQLEFDKSPEPSTYCDGGSGYALSRHAMNTLLEVTQSAAGQALIQVSFMEDKLVGDLLALGSISPSNEDYHISVRRRARPGGIAVSRWLNGFDASRTVPVKLVHLDDSAAQAPANDRLDQQGLFPKKIWPSYQQARLGEQTNALDMVTDASRLTAAREAPVAVVAAMRNEMFMLPHFLAHYRKLGVESFLIADNCSDDGTLEYLAEQPDVALFSVDTDYSRSQYGVAWQQAMMAHFRVGRWSLVADADELLTWQVPQRETLPQLLQRPEFDAADGVRIFMLDMYPQGPLADASFASGDPFAEAGFTDRDPFQHDSFGYGPYSNAPTWTSALRHRLIPGSRRELFVAQKIALLKYSPFMRLSAGLHYVAGTTLAPQELLFGHFKYNADFRRKAQAEVARRQHFNDAEEYRKYLALISEGRDRIYDPDLSVPWSESAFVKARLKQ